MSGDSYARKGAVVTGAAAGIGRALALQLAYRGANLTLWDHDGDGLEAVADRCRRWGPSVRTGVIDVGDRAAVLDHASAAADAGAVDLVFCVAGTIHTGTLLDSDLDDIEHVMQVNLWGTVNTVKALLPRVIASVADTSSRSPAPSGSWPCPGSAPTAPPSSPSVASVKPCARS